MKFIDDFRERKRAEALLEKIRSSSRRGVTIMEICGTHTHSISRYGIRDSLPPTIRLVSGPGCPVCVTSASDINRVIEFSRSRDDVIIATFGDMMRVPGSSSNLMEERAGGADIRVVYSPLNVIETARENPEKEVVFYAVGFETTVPTVAATILKAREEGIRNLSVLSLHKLTPPAMKALMDSGEIAIDGFVCPGHVTAVIGAGAYSFLSTVYRAPCVVAGFEPVDVLLGMYMLVAQLEEGRHDIEIEYKRVVTWEGNSRAKEIMEEVFHPADALWRGIGMIPASGLKINPAYSDLDAEARFQIKAGEDGEPKGCECGSVLKGIKTPPECPLFGRTCAPDTPVGPCMVSSEGTCAAFYRYRGF